MGLPKHRRRSRSQALPPRTAGAGYVGAGTQVVSGHFRSPGALPTDLPCHGRYLRHRGCPGQASPTRTGGPRPLTAGPPASSRPPPPTPRLDRRPDHGLGLTPTPRKPAGTSCRPQRSPQPARHRGWEAGPRPLRGRRTPSFLEEGLPPTKPKVGRGCLTQKTLAYKHPQLTAPPQDQTGQARPQAPAPGRQPREGPSRGCPGRPSPACRPRRSPASCRHLGKPRPGDPPSVRSAPVALAPSGCGRRAGSGRSPALLAAPLLAVRALVPSSARPPARLSVPGSEGGRDARRGRGGARGGT